MHLLDSPAIASYKFKALLLAPLCLAWRTQSEGRASSQKKKRGAKRGNATEQKKKREAKRFAEGKERRIVAAHSLAFFFGRARIAQKKKRSARQGVVKRIELVRTNPFTILCSGSSLIRFASAIK